MVVNDLGGGLKGEDETTTTEAKPLPKESEKDKARG